MDSGYDYTVSGSFGKAAEWLPQEKIEFKQIDKGWNIVLSKEGYVAKREIPQKPVPTESETYKAEARGIASQLLKALTYIMFETKGHNETKPSDSEMIKGPSEISIVAEIPSPALSWTMRRTQTPSIDEIQRFWQDLKTNSVFCKAVDYYLSGLLADSKVEAATELFKAIRIIELDYGGEHNTYSRLGYSKESWKSLRYNIQWLGRHTPEELKQVPKHEMTLDECKRMVKYILEKIRQ